ncbi:hypothetical protein D3C84_711280 [compost metagenome]
MRRFVASTGFNSGAHFATPADQLHFAATPGIQGLGVGRMHVDQRIGDRFIEFFDTLGHGPGVPVFKHPPGAQPEREVRVRGFRRWLVGEREDDCLLVGVAIELHTTALLDIGVVTFAEAPQRFLAFDDGPAQAAFGVITIKGRQVMSMPPAELGIFFEQAFLQVETEIPGLVVLIALSQLLSRELIDLAILEQHLIQGLALVLR